MKDGTRWRALALVVATTVFAGACSNPVSPGDHRIAAGVLIRDGAQEVVRVHGAGATGTITVQAGQQTGPLTVRFLDTAGAEIPPQSGYWLRVESSNTAVADWQQTTAGEHGGRLAGGVAGQATLTFCNMHGAVGSGHADGCRQVTAVVAATP
jgi:hypothetical protein